MLLVASIAVFAMAFYSVINSGIADKTAPELNLAKELSMDPRDEKTLPYAMAKVVRANSVVSEKAPMSSEQAIDRLELNMSDQQLVSVLGNGENGRYLKNILLASRYQEKLPQAGQLQNEAFDRLKQTPDESYRDIIRAYDLLSGDEFVSERTTLAFLASAMPGHESDAANMAYRLLVSKTESIAPGHSMLAVQLHSILIKNALDGKFAFLGTVEALAAQSDDTSRNMISSGFLQHYPQMRDELYEELERRGEKLPLFQ